MMRKSTKWLLIIAVLVVVWVWMMVWRVPDENRVKAIFCDVGQGDATLIMLGNTQMLIDGGPGKAVLDCLDKYLPFNDKVIELVAVTHADQDHIGGIVEVLRNYRVEKLVSTPVISETEVFNMFYNEIENQINNYAMNWANVFAGELIKFDSVVIEVVWPEREWVSDRMSVIKELSSGENGAGVVLGMKDEDEELNNFSLVLHLRYGEFDVLLNGDAGEEVQDEQLDLGVVPAGVEVMNAPHHGSRTGMLDEWLQLVDPQLVVISVGAKNRYGHPAAQILQRLDEVGIRYMRTDEVGDMVVESDGESWWLNNN